MMGAEPELHEVQFTLPQFGIFAQGTHAHHFLEFDLRPGVAPMDAIAAFRRLRTPDVSAGGVNLVIAFGADVWLSVAIPGSGRPRGVPADRVGRWPTRSGHAARRLAVDQRGRA